MKPFNLLALQAIFPCIYFFAGFSPELAAQDDKPKSSPRSNAATEKSSKPEIPTSLWLYEDTQGKPHGGIFMELSPEGLSWKEDSDKTNQRVDWSSVDQIRRNVDSAIDTTTDPSLGTMILLPNGDCLRGEAVATLEKGLAIQSVSIGVVNLPLSQWGGALLQPPKIADQQLHLLNLLRRGSSRPGDMVVLANNDQLQGTLLDLNVDTLSFQPLGTEKPVTLKRQEVIGISIDPRTVKYPESQQRLWKIYLSDGSCLTSSGLNFDTTDPEQAILMTTRWGAEWRIPSAKINRIRVIQPGEQSLADRKADAIQTVDYVGTTPQPRIGTNIQGGPLRLAARTFNEGIGTQSRTLMAYRLTGREKSFQCRIGVDSSAGPLGLAQASVLVDGKPVYDSGLMKSGEPPRFIKIDLNQAKLLILSTEFGEGGSVRDWVNWCEPNLR